MKPLQQNIAQILTYCGTIPLVASALGLMLGVVVLEQVTPIAMGYGAIIIAFLSGIHWAVYVFFAERCPTNLLITSNIAALLAWASLFIPLVLGGIMLQILCFHYLLRLDNKLQQIAILPLWFYRLRRNATVIVIVSLSIIAGFV